jgi:hypothetical protein
VALKQVWAMSFTGSASHSASGSFEFRVAAWPLWEDEIAVPEVLADSHCGLTVMECHHRSASLKPFPVPSAVATGWRSSAGSDI